MRAMCVLNPRLPPNLAVVRERENQECQHNHKVSILRSGTSLTENGFDGNATPTQFSKETLQGKTLRHFRTLTAILDLLGRLGGLFLGLVDTINLDKALLAERTRVFSVGPFFNATKAKHVFANIDRC